MVNNLAARLAGLAALALASLVVARTGGPSDVGDFVLLRVLPWMVGMLLSMGLPGAVPYFLTGARAAEQRYRPTAFAIACSAGAVGTLLWALATPLLQRVFFPPLETGLVMAAGATVFTQSLETTAKACSQGFGDLAGSNRIIALEDLMFLPLYVAMIGLGVDHHVALVASLPLGDLGTGVPGWVRLARKGFFRGTGRPSFGLARDMFRYGYRAQISTMVLLLNARLDFALVGAIVGPAALGVYAIASRYAELLRLPGLAANYVLYPDYARDGGLVAARKASRALGKIGWIPIVLALPLAAGAAFLLPTIYGPAFEGAVVPTYILLFGLSGVSIQGVITAFLYGDGRPGLTSLALSGGLVVTVVLDLLLIPRFGVMGAAVASCAAYLTTTALLVAFFVRVTRSLEGERVAAAPSMEGAAGGSRL
jgi:O-antigen/teichoic acid export membrane protein